MEQSDFRTLRYSGDHDRYQYRSLDAQYSVILKIRVFLASISSVFRSSTSADEKDYCPEILHENHKKVLDMSWYFETRQYFLKFMQSFPGSDTILYPGLNFFDLLSFSEQSAASYKSDEEFQKAHLQKGYRFTDIEKLTSGIINSIEFWYDYYDEMKAIIMSPLSGEKIKFCKQKLSAPVSSQVEGLLRYLNNHPGVNREFCSLIEKEESKSDYWDSHWRAVPENNTHYEYIHEVMCYEIEEEAKVRYSAGKDKLVILDSACGRNPLLEALLRRGKLFQMAFKEIQFVMVDISKVCIETCQAKEKQLREQRAGLPREVKTVYVCADASTFDIRDYKFDIIATSGGITRSEVGRNRKEAIAFMSQLIKTMEPGSIYMENGLGYSLLESETLKELGFNILVATDKWSEPEKSQEKNFFVVKKPEHPGHSPSKSSSKKHPLLSFFPSELPPTKTSTASADLNHLSF